MPHSLRRSAGGGVVLPPPSRGRTGPVGGRLGGRRSGDRIGQLHARGLFFRPWRRGAAGFGHRRTSAGLEIQGVGARGNRGRRRGRPLRRRTGGSGIGPTLRVRRRGHPAEPGGRPADAPRGGPGVRRRPPAAVRRRRCVGGRGLSRSRRPRSFTPRSDAEAPIRIGGPPAPPPAGGRPDGRLKVKEPSTVAPDARGRPAARSLASQVPQAARVSFRECSTEKATAGPIRPPPGFGRAAANGGRPRGRRIDDRFGRPRPPTPRRPPPAPVPRTSGKPCVRCDRRREGIVLESMRPGPARAGTGVEPPGAVPAGVAADIAWAPPPAPDGAPVRPPKTRPIDDAIPRDRRVRPCDAEGTKGRRPCAPLVAARPQSPRRNVDLVIAPDVAGGSRPAPARRVPRGPPPVSARRKTCLSPEAAP